jgi:diguanylate cyclase (GGDEF)-like protein
MKPSKANLASADNEKTTKIPAKRSAIPLVLLDGAARRPDEAGSARPVAADELTPRTRRALDRLEAEVHGLRQELEQARRQIAELEDLADRDALTPLLNRRAFVRELARVLSFAERYGLTGSLLYFDVNGLKQINDGLGHAAGDAVLSHIARILSGLVRDTDVVGRLGGDEFGVILAQSDGVAAAAKARELARAIQAEPVVHDGRAMRVRVAFGVHSFAAGERAKEALAAADRAMYLRKSNSKPPALTRRTRLSPAPPLRQ